MDNRLIWAYFMRVKLLVFIFSSWQKERDAFMRFRKKFLAILLAVIITSIAFFVAFIQPAPSASVGTQTQNWLSGWNYRKSHTIAGSPGAGADYQIKIIAHYQKGADLGSDVYLDSKCQTNFNDVRFTDDNSVTLFDYWLETKTDGNYAFFWVKVNANLDYNQTIYIYYGNSTVSSASNIDKTFPFADDFSGSSLNATKWRPFGSGKVTVAGDECVLESVPEERGWIYILGNTLVGTNYSIRFSSLVIEQGADRWTHHGFATIFNSSDNQGGRIDEYPNYITASQESTYYAWSLRTRAYTNTTRVDISNLEPNVGTFYTYEIQRNGTTSVILTCDDAYQASISTNVPSVNLGALFGADNAGSPLYSVTVIDWVILRKYVANEPLQGAWGTEESLLTNKIFGVG
jgi:hypothetical protein